MDSVQFAVYLLLFTCVVTAVHGITIDGLSGTKTAGGSDNLRITCLASSDDAARHHGLTLSRNLSSSTYQNLVTVVQENSQTIITWSDQIGDFRTRTRATATGQATSSSSSLTLDLPDFECSDAGIYKCSLNGANQDYTPVLIAPSATATLSVIGRNGNISLSLTEYLEPGASSPQRVNDDRDKNFQRYYKVGTVVTMECKGELIKSTSTQNQNSINWYRLRFGWTSWERYYPIFANDITTTTEHSKNLCLQKVTSTLRYKVSSVTDKDGSSFRCQTASTLGGPSTSNHMEIYLQNSVDGTTETATGRNGNLSLSLREYLEPGASSPQRVYDDIDNNFQTNQRYYKVDTVITMECEGELSKPTSTIQNTQTQTQNNIGWYKLRPSARSWERYHPTNNNDVTTRTTAGSMNSCLQIVTSTLRYNVSYIFDNGGTSFRCRAASTLGGMSESNSIRIYAVNFITIDGLSGTKTAGLDNLRITCRADISSHHGLTLSRNLNSLNFQNLVTVVEENSQIFIEWPAETEVFRFRTRATATGHVTSNSTTLTVEVPDFDCSDAGIYKCSLENIGSPATATLSVIGQNSNISLSITEFLEPEAKSPQRIIAVKDNNSFKIGTVMTMKCEGKLNKRLSTQSTQNWNRMDWYKLSAGSTTWKRYYGLNAIKSTTTILGISTNSCLQRVTSTLRYNVSYIADHGGTSFRCQVASRFGGMSKSNEMKIYADVSIDGATRHRYTIIVTYSLMLLSRFVMKILI